jgi:hypothetical protein
MVLEARKVIQVRLEKGLKDIVCPHCEGRVPLLDLIEEKFVSSEFEGRVRQLDEQANINLDRESQELILIGHAYAVANEAGQAFRKGATTVRADGEIEFMDDHGQPSGSRIFVRLKRDDVTLSRREDGTDLVTFYDPRLIDEWSAAKFPVMLVTRTAEGAIKWMNMTDRLIRGVKNNECVFEGDPFTALNLIRLRAAVLGGHAVGAQAL